MPKSSGPIRVLLATSMDCGETIVIATDSDWVGWDVENINSCADDLGIHPLPDSPGIWLWEGKAELWSQQTIDHIDPPEPEYTGTVRRVVPEELPELLTMVPPEREVDDDTTTLSDNDGETP